jgi:hypothetical protein
MALFSILAPDWPLDQAGCTIKRHEPLIPRIVFPRGFWMDFRLVLMGFDSAVFDLTRLFLLCFLAQCADDHIAIVTLQPGHSGMDGLGRGQCLSAPVTSSKGFKASSTAGFTMQAAMRRGRWRVSKPARPKLSAEGFFLVDRRAWAHVCKFGMNAAIAYLVIASGTRGANRNSRWSTHSIEVRTDISRSRAAKAIQELERAGAVCRNPDSKPSSPRYTLRHPYEIKGCEGYVPALSREQQAFHTLLGESWVEVPRYIDPSDPDDQENWNRWMIEEPRKQAELLVLSGHAERHPDGRQYRALQGDVANKPDWIFLPNSLIEGIADEVAPVELVRQTDDVPTLRLLVNLYRVHHLYQDGGIHFSRLRFSYDRHQVGHWGEFTIWGFKPSRAKSSVHASLLAELEGACDSEAQQRSALKAFADCLGRLLNLGLIQWIDHLVHTDNEEGEILHPLPLRPTDRAVEHELTIAARHAAFAMLTPGKVDWAESKGFVALVPVKRHMEAVQLVGIARLRYRPWTAPTKAFVDRDREWQAIASRFRELEDHITAQAQASQFATSRRRQGSSR